eukprot:NODE_6167_length_564_cov_30.366133_g6002_i0.p1 GENE.NODE_6167_length_564_cov_30.366133_g6002_i0~~NODE_6167_length_564_cov_30.366133_g6002_i0.p1  ORF type:complete len:154 (-),score=33.14 NODE_6167_length_564_cov_30.366133_g6002_i0:37-498(-)
MKWLVAVDGSEPSNRSIASVGTLATHSDEVTFYKCYTAPSHTMNFRDPRTRQSIISSKDMKEMDEGANRKAAAILEGAHSLYLQQGGQAPSHQILEEHRDCREAILRAAKTANADTIVVGSRGLGIVSRAILGSVSQYVINHADKGTNVFVAH